MKRKFLFECYGSAKGQLLLQQEADFLQRSITVSCKQSILLIGGLGWESKFIDGSLYRRFVVMDPGDFNSDQGLRITAHAAFLPIKSDTIDMVIMPHALEFESNQHQSLREIARVLKPEGKLIILNFNPWNYWVRYRYMIMFGKVDPLMKKFIRKSKIIDWLKLLNFDVDIVAGFKFTPPDKFSGRNKKSPVVVSYAVKAIKRRYNVIPLAPVRVYRPKLAVAGIEPSNRSALNERYRDYLYRRRLPGESRARRLGRCFTTQKQ